MSESLSSVLLPVSCPLRVQQPPFNSAREAPRVRANVLDRVREIVLALPEVTERLSHGATCFFVRDKRPICYFHDHHNDDHVSLWCPAPPGVQAALVAGEPRRFFRPPTSARGTFSTWLGVYLDTSVDDPVDWDELAEILEDAFRLVAPASAVATLDHR